MGGIFDIGVVGLTIVKLSKIYAGSKDKDCKTYESVVASVKARCKQKYITGQNTRQVNGAEHNRHSQTQEALHREPVGTLTKDISERVIQHMVIRNILYEDSTMNTSGFNSEYLVRNRCINVF